MLGPNGAEINTPTSISGMAKYLRHVIQNAAVLTTSLTHASEAGHFKHVSFKLVLIPTLLTSCVTYYFIYLRAAIGDVSIDSIFNIFVVV